MRFLERFIFLLGIAAALKVLNLNAVVASEKIFFLENAFKTNETATASLGLHYYPNSSSEISSSLRTSVKLSSRFPWLALSQTIDLYSKLSLAITSGGGFG